MLAMQVFNTNHEMRAQGRTVRRQGDARIWAEELLILNKRPGTTRQNIKHIKHYRPHNSL